MPLGFLALRLSLNDKNYLWKVGMAILSGPSQRRKGFGKMQLDGLTGLAARTGTGAFTCDNEDNKKADGVAPFCWRVFTKIQSTEVNNYWIDLEDEADEQSQQTPRMEK